MKLTKRMHGLTFKIYGRFADLGGEAGQTGQDLIEYALMAGFISLAVASIVPGITVSLATIFSKVNSIMVAAASS